MAIIECDIKYVNLETNKGSKVRGVRVTCTECDHYVESFGRGDPSIRRCRVLLSKECPNKQNNYYVTADELKRDPK